MGPLTKSVVVAANCIYKYRTPACPRCRSFDRQFQTKLRHPYSESPFFHSLLGGKTAYRRGASNIARQLNSLA